MEYVSPFSLKTMRNKTDNLCPMKLIFFIIGGLTTSFLFSCSSNRDEKGTSVREEVTTILEDTVPKTLVEAILDDYQYKYTHRRPNVEKDSCFYFNFYLSYQDSCYYAIVTGDQVEQYFSVEYDRKKNSYNITPSFIGYAILGKYHVAIDWLKGKEGPQIPAFLEGIHYIDVEMYVERYVSSSFFGDPYDPFCCKYKIKDNSFTFEKKGYW